MNTVNVRAYCMRPILAAGFALALAFTFSACGSDDNGGNLPDPSGSSEEKVFCNLTAGNCSQMSLSACMELVNAGAAQIVANCTEPPPPPSSSSSQVSAVQSYCDYGYETSNGGGCFQITPTSNCNAEWGKVVSECGKRTDLIYCRRTSGDHCYSTTAAQCDAGDIKVADCTVNISSSSSNSFKTVKIGEQTWMAENLNIIPTATGAATNSACYNNIPANCATYGRLYDWATAMGLPASCNTSTTCTNQIRTPHQGICPENWHIPTDDDWGKLFSFLSNSMNETEIPTYIYANLITQFSGGGYPNGNFGDVGYYNHMWNAEDFGIMSIISNVSSSYESNILDDFDKTYLFSVRCVKNGG